MLAAALIVFAAATLGLVLLIEPIPSWYYHLAWWSYIAAADVANHRLAGRSLLRSRPSHFLWLAAVSVLWWTVFELINLRLGNWYYVMDDPRTAVRWTGGVLAFATVLPGIVETLELVENAGWLRSVRVQPLPWSAAKARGTVALGAACFALPLVWPDVFYPLAWGSFVFLLEPWNRRHGRRSFLRDLEQGEAGPLCRTLVAGLFCGALWETWNFWARTKWIYTVPVFEQLKLFEMPILGFLGFPPFAVECVVVLRFLGALRDRLPERHVAATRAAAVLLGPPVVIGMFALVDPVTVDSFYAPTAELDVLAPRVRQALADAGLVSPERALRALRTDQGRREWARRLGLEAPLLDEAHDRIALMLHRGLGDGRARQLVAAGIRGTEDLAAWSPDALADALRGQGAQGRDRFLERRARVWIDGASDPTAARRTRRPGPGGRP